MEKIFNKAKVGLMRNASVFLSTVTFSLQHRFSDEIPTAGTDGLSVIYNPEWFKSLGEEERIGLMAHEVWHVVFAHMTRRGNRDPKIWNYAGDHVINNLLLQSKFKLPEPRLCDTKYAGWGTVAVYDDLIEKGTQPNKDFVCDILSPGSMTAGDEDADEQTGPGKTASDVENQIKGMLVKANTTSKMSGESQGALPGEATRMMDELLNPKLNYDEILHRFMDDQAKDDYSWTRPNRRYMPDFYLPGQYSEALGHITVAIDTSGSVSDEDMKKMLSEINYIRERYKPKMLVVMDCDWDVYHVHEMDENDDRSILDLELKGGGGTAFEPVMKKCSEMETNLLIYFTDLYADPIKEEQPFPIVWLCHSNHEPAEIGETIYFDREDL